MIGNAIARIRAMEELESRTAELVAKNAEMESVIYTVSHDLRSPLMAIRGLPPASERTPRRATIGVSSRICRGLREWRRRWTGF